jgi:hypothetical protein
MTLLDFVRLLNEVVEKNPEVAPGAQMYYRVPGSDTLYPATFTLTYTSERVAGTTMHEQIPIVLIEVKDE